jgi:hypothetical protein
VSGVGAVLGVVSGVVFGVVPEEPPVPPDPPEAPFGQSAPVCVPGVVVPLGGMVDAPPSDGVVGLVDAEGAGLAAETAATPPPTRSRPATSAVMAVRRRPPGAFTGSAWIAEVSIAEVLPGDSGSKMGSIGSPCSLDLPGRVGPVRPMFEPQPERVMRDPIDAAT